MKNKIVILERVKGRCRGCYYENNNTIGMSCQKEFKCGTQHCWKKRTVNWLLKQQGLTQKRK